MIQYDLLKQEPFFAVRKTTSERVSMSVLVIRRTDGSHKSSEQLRTDYVRLTMVSRQLTKGITSSADHEDW